MRLSRLTAPALAIVLAAACASPQATYDYDEAVDFSRYRRWAWLPMREEQPSGDPLIDNPLTRQRIESAVARSLAAKGYEKSDPAAADFEVGYAVTVEGTLGSSGASTTFGFGRYGGGSGVGISISSPGIPIREQGEGMLIIDVRDPASGKLVWRGSSTRRIGRSGSPEESEQTIDRIVAEILANFPPERGG